MGGLIVRYACAVLAAEGFFRAPGASFSEDPRPEPLVYLSAASPHLGSRRTPANQFNAKWWNKIGPRLGGRSTRQLFLADEGEGEEAVEAGAAGAAGGEGGEGGEGGKGAGPPGREGDGVVGGVAGAAGRPGITAPTADPSSASAPGIMASLPPPAPAAGPLSGGSSSRPVATPVASSEPLLVRMATDPY